MAHIDKLDIQSDTLAEQFFRPRSDVQRLPVFITSFPKKRLLDKLEYPKIFQLLYIKTNKLVH